MLQSTSRTWAYTLTGIAFGLYLLANCFPMYSFAVGLGDPVVEWFLSVTTQMSFSVKGYPLVIVIADLFWKGEYLLALIVLAFTVLFPLVKMIGVLLLLSRCTYDRLADSTVSAKLADIPVFGWVHRRMFPRTQLASTLEKIGPWSMLDVFVLSVVTVMLKQAEGTVYKLEAGIYLFTLSVLTQIASSRLAATTLERTMTADSPSSTPTPHNALASPGQTPGRIWRWSVVVQGLILAVVVVWIAWERLSASRVVYYPGTVVVGGGSSPTRLYSDGDIEVGGHLKVTIPTNNSDNKEMLDFAELVAKWKASPLTQTAEFDISLNTGAGTDGQLRLGASQEYVHPDEFGRKVHRVLITPISGFAAMSQLKSLKGFVDPNNPRRAKVEVHGDPAGDVPRLVQLRVIVFYE